MDMTGLCNGEFPFILDTKTYSKKLLDKGSRVIGPFKEGNYLAMEGYGPVSVGKVAMEGNY
ncbi:MAG: hypothetical protein Ct9H300mP18_04890 [Candidatus Neomarinimicrobiota bacterium]|nr:MAG: hypothetical protein Ct9H300mP18_04890 [Candidatus Neomarinimicrobiota bacterium]